MTGLGIVLLIVGLILWLTVLPALGWILMAIGVVPVASLPLAPARRGRIRAGRGRGLRVAAPGGPDRDAP